MRAGNANRAVRVIVIALVAAAALAANALPATARTVATGRHDFATIGGQYVFYLGGATRRVADEHVQVDVIRFDRNTGLKQAMFTAPAGWAITRLTYRGGRLFVLLVADPNNETGPTRLISMDGGGAGQLELAATPSDPAPGTDCLPYLYVANISPEGEAIVDLFSGTGFPGSDCAAIRLSTNVRSIAPDGTKTDLLSETSPWLAGTSDDLALGALYGSGVWGASGDWLLKYDATGHMGTDLVVRNRVTGATYPTSMSGVPDDFRVWPDGSAFMSFESNCYGCGGFFFPDITKRKSIPIERKRITSSFRVCGDRILELYTSLPAPGRPAKSRLALRDHTGKVVRTLHRRVPRNAELVDCDAGTALLRRVPPPVPPQDTGGDVGATVPSTGTGRGTGTGGRSSKNRAKSELLYTVPLG